ncbi:glycosyltransferase, partial [Aeromonas hydrophila]|uniref:glycosyltransferase n=3 Tax=Aeromonadaceae TaxID=84642 RepID=UPI002B05D030
YILTVSSLEPRKNLQLLIDAFTELNIDHVQLYIVGTTNKVFNFSGFTDLTSSNVKFLGYVSDQELEALYRGAEFFVYPSLYEGFGLPPTEAISYGTPILCSDIDSIKEVCGDVPEYFHTNDLSHLKKMIVSMLETPKSKEIYSLEAEKQLLLLKTKQERYSILNAIDE